MALRGLLYCAAILIKRFLIDNAEIRSKAEKFMVRPDAASYFFISSEAASAISALPSKPHAIRHALPSPFISTIPMECSGSRMLSHIFFRNLFRIFTESIGIVQRIPHLRKERIHLCSIAVVPASAFALVAPVTAIQDKPRAGSEFIARKRTEIPACRSSRPCSFLC